MADPVLRLHVYGTPGTAGSKSAFPLWRNTADGGRELLRIRQVEKDRAKVKENWRLAVIGAAQDVVVDPGTDRFRPPFPLDEALVATMVFTVKKPTGAPKTVRTWPTSRPDVLKYARAAEDALQAAGVLKDDARVVRYEDLAKVYPGEDEHALDAPGAVILVWRMAELTFWQRDTILAPEAGPTLFDPETPPGGVTASPPPGASGRVT